VARFWHFPGQLEAHRDELPAKMKGGYHALDVMEQHLKGREFFVGAGYSIADIALYAYTHVADEGGFELGAYPHIEAWLARVAGQPRHVGITDAVGRLVLWP
jgi:glutathione S-transferase